MKFFFSRYPYLIQFLPQYLKQHKNWLKNIISENTEVINYIDPSLQKDPEYIFSFFQAPKLYYALEPKAIEIRAMNQEMMTEESRIKRANKRKREKLLLGIKNELEINLQLSNELVICASKERCYEALNYIPNHFKEDLSFWLNFIIASRPDLVFFHYMLDTNPHLFKLNEQYQLKKWDVVRLMTELPTIIEKEKLEKILDREQFLVNKNKKI